MKTTKHTPGPWILDQQWALIVDSRGNEIAACHSGAKEANARLIAAAPEMLEALEAIEPLLHEHLTGGYGHVIYMIQDAIRKARGEK